MEEPDTPPPCDFPSFFLGSGLGYFLYQLLRNDHLWRLMSDAERALVMRHNHYYNTHRPGYDDPDRFPGGLTFHSQGDRLATWKGQQLHDFLGTYRPARVLEMGPGSGYYSRLIVDHPALTSYQACDINPAFLHYIKGALAEREELDQGFYVIDEIEQAPPVDAIVALATLHHVPDRKDFLAALARRTRAGGHLFLFDPSHSLVRLQDLCHKMIKHRWYLKRVRMARNNFSTHHFCTHGELAALCKEGPWSLVSFTARPRFPWMAPMPLLRNAFAVEMAAVLKKE